MFDRYTKRIIEILSTCDRSNISLQAIRMQIQQDYKVDLTQKKVKFERHVATLYASLYSDLEDEVAPPENNVNKNNDQAQSDHSSENVKIRNIPVETATNSVLVTKFIPGQKLPDFLKPIVIVNDPSSINNSNKNPESSPDQKQKTNSEEGKDSESNSQSKPKPEKQIALQKSKKGDKYSRIPEENIAIQKSDGPGYVAVKKSANSVDPKSSKLSKSDEKSANIPKNNSARVAPSLQDLNVVYYLTPELAAICGVKKLVKKAISQKIWEYIRANKLQDPKDKQYILSDQNFRKLTGVHRFFSLELSDVIAKNLVRTDTDEPSDPRLEKSDEIVTEEVIVESKTKGLKRKSKDSGPKKEHKLTKRMPSENAKTKKPNVTAKPSAPGAEKLYRISPILQKIVKMPVASHAVIFDKIWKYVRVNHLQKAQTVFNDTLLESVFKRSQTTMFEMSRLIESHLIEVPETVSDELEVMSDSSVSVTDYSESD